MDGAERTLMARIHRLEHLERLGAANFADDDPVRTHAQRVSQQVALGDRVVAHHIGRTRLHLDHMPLLQCQLQRIFDRHDPLAPRDIRRERIQERGLAAARAAADQDVQLVGRARPEELRHPRVQGVRRNQVFDAVAVSAKLAHRDRRLHRSRWRDRDVHA